MKVPFRSERNAFCLCSLVGGLLFHFHWLQNDGLMCYHTCLMAWWRCIWCVIALFRCGPPVHYPGAVFPLQWVHTCFSAVGLRTPFTQAYERLCVCVPAIWQYLHILPQFSSFSVALLLVPSSIAISWLYSIEYGYGNVKIDVGNEWMDTDWQGMAGQRQSQTHKPNIQTSGSVLHHHRPHPLFHRQIVWWRLFYHD